MYHLYDISEKRVHDVSLRYTRYLFEQINWENRLIGIKGARGTGKTTLLLQWLKKKELPSSRAVYFSADDLYFTDHSLVDTGTEFYNKGGKILVFDEVHKYQGWAREIKILHDRYADLQIIFTGSSIIDISRQESDLSRRAMMYELHGLSYREFLKMNGFLNSEPVSFQNLIADSQSIRDFFPSSFRPLEHFNSYLDHGYYPFWNEDQQGYHARLRQLVRLIVESDMAELQGFDIRNARKMLQLTYIIAQQVPFKPNLVKLAAKTQIHRNSISNYLYYLEEARLIKLLYPAGISIATLQKPEKLFLNNTNFMFALSSGMPSKGTLRETFFYNQVSVLHQVRQPDAGDFMVDEQYIFELGGISKGKKQINHLPNARTVKDDMEYPAGGALPLWLFGFLY